LESAKETIAKQTLKLGEPVADSSNSSQPGSTDIGKKPKPQNTKDNGQKRKGGGQPNHKPQNRRKFTQEQINKTNVFDPPSTTSECGCQMNRWKKDDPTKQQIELPVFPPEIIEHRGQAYNCPKCGSIHRSRIPEEIKRQSLIGPGLLNFMISLRFDGNVSIRKIQQILKDNHGLEFSLGFLAQVINNSSQCLESSYEEIKENIKKQPILNIDETPHKENGKRLST
jgi:transposase